MSPVLARYSIGPNNSTRDRGRAWCIRNLVEKSGLREDTRESRGWNELKKYRDVVAGCGGS